VGRFADGDADLSRHNYERRVQELRPDGAGMSLIWKAKTNLRKFVTAFLWAMAESVPGAVSNRSSVELTDPTFHPVIKL
jgi:hypothetical protein